MDLNVNSTSNSDLISPTPRQSLHPLYLLLVWCMYMGVLLNLSAFTKLILRKRLKGGLFSIRDALLCNATAVNLAYILVAFWLQGHFYYADDWESETTAHAVSMSLFDFMTGAALVNVVVICGVQVFETIGKLPRRPLHHHTVTAALTLASWIYCLVNTVPWFVRHGDPATRDYKFQFFQFLYGFAVDLILPFVAGTAFLIATAILTKKTRPASSPSPVVQWQGNRPHRLIETQLSSDLKMPSSNGSTPATPEDGSLLFFHDQYSDPLINDGDRGSGPSFGDQRKRFDCLPLAMYLTCVLTEAPCLVALLCGWYVEINHVYLLAVFILGRIHGLTVLIHPILILALD